MTLTMVGRLSECVLLAYRVPVDRIAHLVPRGLEPVTHGGFAFWNVVACRIDRMRPAGLPRWCGISYHHVAYRIYVRAKTATGERIEGLYFVRSDADSALISAGGNLMSDFVFNTSPIRLSSDEDGVRLEVDGAAPARLRVRDRRSPSLEPGSCFGSYAEAAAFLEYKPTGLSVDATGRWIELAEVIRDEREWRESQLEVVEADWQFFRDIGSSDAALELATRVVPIDYRWRLGRRLPSDHSPVA